MSNENYWEQFETVETAHTSEIKDKFKMQNEGDVARIFLPLVNPQTNQVALKRVEYFDYNDKVSGQWARFISPADSNGQAYKKAVAFCGGVKTRYVTPILVYSTNTQGRVLSGDDYEIKVLVVTPQRLKELKSLSSENNLGDFDLSATLMGAKFQDIKFQVLKSCGVKQGKIPYKDRSGNVKEMNIGFNLQDVVKEAMDIMQDAETAVASKWGDEQILNFFDSSESEYDTMPAQMQQTTNNGGSGFYDQKFSQSGNVELSQDPDELF